MKKQFIEEQALLEDAFRLAVNIFDSGFRPDFIVGIWRGGSTVGIYVQECLQYLGVKTDHIAIRTSYRGQPSYGEMIENPASIRVHGLQYLFENLNREDRLLIVDDVFDTGRTIAAVIDRRQVLLRQNIPTDIRVATPYYKPSRRQVDLTPDYYLYENDEWLVYPYEIHGLTREEMMQNKPALFEILKDHIGDDLR